MIRIAVDAMGGDFGPSVTLAASLAFLDHHPEAAIVLVGQPDVLAAQPQFSASSPTRAARSWPPRRW